MTETFLGLDEIKQRHVDKFFAEMRKTFPSWRSMPLTEVSSAYVRSAVAAGILSGLETPVDGMAPSAVSKLAGEVDGLLAQVLSVPNA